MIQKNYPILSLLVLAALTSACKIKKEKSEAEELTETVSAAVVSFEIKRNWKDNSVPKEVNYNLIEELTLTFDSKVLLPQGVSESNVFTDRVIGNDSITFTSGTFGAAASGRP